MLLIQEPQLSQSRSNICCYLLAVPFSLKNQVSYFVILYFTALSIELHPNYFILFS